ncbi:hypothetical protein PMZ80_009291 [Knufia obscura]|uniref:Uncharacterized protein n=2 Tax=Knufia TaxID=430999 RepID=A0AAN8EPM8_9EURO|nr:hypothetical protein PMZ80_009291 [Knufia obscura]KAK5955752.1 hypothetical protein OHC33_003393 [Knufia fluminis]
MESLERLQGLHADLIAHSQKSLSNIDRLWQELHDSIQDFKTLLDQTKSTDAEAKAFREGKIEVAGQEYAINEEFRQLSVAIGTALGISEEHAGRLIIQTQASGSEDEQATIADVVQKYHDRRDYLLQDLRLALQQSEDLDLEEDARAGYKEVVETILDTKNGVIANGSAFARKCMQAMGDIEARQITLNEQIQSKAILSQARGEAFYRTLEFQRSSLFKQHEALGAILALLFRGNHTISEDLRKLHERAQKWQRLDFSWIHYLPAFAAAFQRYGSPEGNSAQSQEAVQLNKLLIAKTPDDPNGPYRPLAATLEMWWTAEYSGFWRDNAAPDSDAATRTATMKKALDDGALEFMLSICTNMKSDPWQQSARHELVEMLLDGSNISFDGVDPTSSYFLTMMMEAYEAFADAWITNMPDSIRKLKSDEDDQRLKQITASSVDGVLQPPPRDQGVRLHLEAFLVVIAFAYENRPEAAEQWWEDPDGNLYGFLHWASRRQTVPRVSAFCEMLCAVSELSENAHAAHRFLLDDAAPVPSIRGKKLPSLNYQQIFAELDFYSKKVHEKAQQSQTIKSRQQSEPELNEAESPIMLSCYLRLLAHLFRQTLHARDYVLNLQGVDLPKSLLHLSSGPIPSFLRAGIFAFFEALLTDKEWNTSRRMWFTIDEWASTNHDRAISTTGDKQPPPTTAALQNTLSAIAASYNHYDAFLKLLVALVDPLPEISGQPIPFPPDLGSNYRFPGVVPYVDLVCGQFTVKNLQSWVEDGNSHGYIRIIACIDFMLACLNGFNENYVTALDRSSGTTNDEIYYQMYSQRHPFARVMQWVFSTSLNKCLMELLHQPKEVVETTDLDDPKIINLQRAVELLNSIMSLQPTYFDLIKPKKVNDGYRIIQFSGITAIEDSIIGRPELLLDICRYAASDHVQLSLQSLELLQKLSESARFQNHLFDETKRDRTGRHMIEMMGPTGEAQLKHISSALAAHFAIDDRELEHGSQADGYLLKDGILSFFNACLATQSESPNIAHLLLGFERIGNRLGFTSEFDQGTSMFDALAGLSTNYPDALEGNLLSWLLHTKAETICVLKHLWSFSVSSDLAMVQLRRMGFLTQQLSRQSTVAQNSLWDGMSIVAPDFYFRTSAEAFTDFLSFRRHLYDYVTREIQSVATVNIKALQEKYLGTFQGKTIGEDGVPTNHSTIYELFDFAELDTREPEALLFPRLEFLNDIDFDAYEKDQLYEIDKVQVVLNRRCAQIVDYFRDANRPVDEDALHNEADYMVGLLQARNRHVLTRVERIYCLRSYVDMIVSIVDCCPMESATKTQFILHMLQLILPKLDTYLSDGAPEAVELTRMADTLLYALSNIETASSTKTQTRIDITVAEKLFQLFRICVEGVPLSATNPDLRAVLYSICAQYLTRIVSSPASNTDSSKKARSNAMDTIRSAGSQVITILSDDADDGLDTCRLNALNLLSQLVSVARSQNSNLIIESFIKSNILEVLLDPIKNIAEEFSITEPNNRTYLLVLFEARTHLLLQVSRTRPGASALLDANLVQTLRDSALFSADPDLGFDLNLADPAALMNTAHTNARSTNGAGQKTALVTYFTLLSTCLRLLLSTFLSFGPENEKMIYLVRTFLADYRGNMVGVFKRAAGLNLASQTNVAASLGVWGPGVTLSASDRELRKVVDECLKTYTGLAVGSGFLEFEDERGLGGNGIATAGFGRSAYGGGNGFT